MAPAGRDCDGLRGYFAEKAKEARRLRLYRYNEAARKSKGKGREEFVPTLMQYRAEGATHRELADIFGYRAASSISVIVKQERAKSENELHHAKARQSTRAPSLSRDTDKKGGRQWTRKLELVRTQGKLDFGFDVEEREKNEFEVTAVRVGGAAARAGLATGDMMVKYKPLSTGERGGKRSEVVYEPWGCTSLNEIDATPSRLAIRVGVRSVKKQLGSSTEKQRRCNERSCARSTNLHEYLSRQKTTGRPSNVAAAPSSLGKRRTASDLADDAASAEDVDDASVSADSSDSESSYVDDTASNKSTKMTSRAKAPRRATAAQRSGVSFRQGPNKRALYCVRLDGEDTVGFSVDQSEGELFRVSHVEDASAAARAGIAAGQWVVSYKLSPMKSSGTKGSRSSSRVFEPWTQNSLDDVNQHPVNQAIAIKVMAPSGFSRECTDRMNHIQHAKQSIFTSRVRSVRAGRLNKFVIQYDRWLLANTGASKRHGDSGDTLAQDYEAEAPTRSHVPECGPITIGSCNANEHASDASTTTILSDEERADVTERATTPISASKPPAKRLKPEPLYHALRTGCWVEFFQAGRPLIDPHRAFLTPETLQNIKKSELTDDVVLFFFMRMTQFIPYRRLRVLPPAFYHSAVLKSEFAEWQPFLNPHAPVVYLPVFESGRWVLVVVVSTDTRVIANYLDCQNPEGFLLPVCSRIIQYIDAAYDAMRKSNAGSEVAKPLVVSKPIQSTTAAQPSDSGVFIVSYFAAIVHALTEHGEELKSLDRVIANASFDRIFSREQLEQEARWSWTDCMQPRIGWGRLCPDICRPCLRLNLRRSSIQPQTTHEDTGKSLDVAVIYLLDEQPEVRWLSERELFSFDVIQRSELVDKLGLTQEDARKLAPFYDCMN